MRFSVTLVNNGADMAQVGWWCLWVIVHAARPRPR
jgi:hypothetical protein